MLDPLIEWIKGIFGRAVAGIRWLIGLVIAFVLRIWQAVTSPFRAVYRFYKRSGWIVRGIIILILLPFVVGYAWFFWQVAYIRNYDVDYPDKLNLRNTTLSAGEAVSAEGGEKSTRTCGSSNVVRVTAYLLDFNVNQNVWLSSNPIYKAGFFWIVPWSHTWFFDNKAAFQRGVHGAASITAIELANALGRVRGTSKEDTDLKIAKGNVQFDQYTWWFNPFDSQPFGPTTPTPTYYRKAITALNNYNKRLAACEATFDARADNLLQFLDRVAKDIGSMSARIKDRAEQYNSGWFDTRADDLFMEAKGELYAYYGLLKALRADFPQVVKSRDLGDIWNRMDEHIRYAISLDPLVISNGKEDGWFMPTHLTTMGFYILRARSNLVEIRSVLDR